MPTYLEFFKQPYSITATAASLSLSLIGAKQTSMNNGERQRTAAAIAVLGEGQLHARKMMKLVVSIWMKNCLGNYSY